MTTLQDFFAQKIKLPSPPAIALKILEAVRKDENSFEELARIISADPALTARILKIANSALYGFPTPVKSLSQATALVGFNTLKNIALSFIIVQDMQRATMGGFDMNLFWRRAITAAVAAETLAEEIGYQDRDLFISALLQDIGVLILYLSDPVTYAAMQDEKRVSGLTTCEAERRQFGFDHTEVGSHLLSTWKLPESIWRPIRFHHSDIREDKYGDCALVLYLSDKVAAIYHGLHSNRKSMEVHDLLAEAYQFSDEQSAALIDKVGEKAQEVMEMFSIDPGNMKPFSLIMQEANEELGRLNLSYAQLVLELKQAKQNAEQLAMELKLANDSLRKLAFRDGLTGLYNHRYFQEILEAELERSSRYNHPLSMILADIDHFKKVNDHFGHPAGDHVLKMVAEMLVSLVRRCDIVSRYGGEEFTIILPETGINSARILAQRIRRGIEQMHITYDDRKIPVTISCGIASTEVVNGNITRTELIERSDQALYRAKKSGRNRVEVDELATCVCND